MHLGVVVHVVLYEVTELVELLFRANGLGELVELLVRAIGLGQAARVIVRVRPLGHDHHGYLLSLQAGHYRVSRINSKRTTALST